MKHIKEIFTDLMADYSTRKHRKVLRAEDFSFIHVFMSQTANMDPNDRQLILNRLWMDNPDKPKNWPYISEFLQFINSRDYAQRYPRE